MSQYVDLTWKGEGDLALYARDYARAGGAARCPVICIHGLTRNSADFEDVAPWIASLGRRVIARRAMWISSASQRRRSIGAFRDTGQGDDVFRPTTCFP